MGRADIRRQVRQGQVMSVDEHNRLTDAKIRAIKHIWVKQYSTCMAFVLRDKFGFGQVRSQRFIEALGEVMADVERGYLTIDDMAKTLEDEIQLLIK